MTYRGIVQNGIVIIENPDGLRDGTVVDVQPAGRRAKKSRDLQPRPAASAPNRSAKKAKALKSRARRASGDPLFEAFGLWKNRPEWKGKSTIEIAAELRRKAMGRLGA